MPRGLALFQRNDGDDVFVHFRAIRGEGHRTLIQGQRVEFTLVQAEKGLQAADVSALRLKFVSA